MTIPPPMAARKRPGVREGARRRVRAPGSRRAVLRVPVARRGGLQRGHRRKGVAIRRNHRVQRVIGARSGPPMDRANRVAELPENPSLPLPRGVALRPSLKRPVRLAGISPREIPHPGRKARGRVPREGSRIPPEARREKTRRAKRREQARRVREEKANPQRVSRERANRVKASLPNRDRDRDNEQVSPPQDSLEGQPGRGAISPAPGA